MTRAGTRLSATEKSEKRNQILAELRNQIAVKGIAGITMRDLAQASGVTTMTLYSLFGSKDALLAETLRDAHRAVVASIFSAPEFHHRDQPPLDALIEYVMASARFNLTEPNYSRAIIYAYYSADDSLAAFHRTFHDYFGGVVIRAYLTTMIEAGELKDWVSTTLLSKQIGESMFTALAEWTRGGTDDAEFLDVTLFGVLTILIGFVSPSAEQRLEALLKELTIKIERKLK